MDLEPLIAETRHLLEKGDNVRAYDTVQRALEAGAFDPRLAHLALLSLARSGATRQALDYFEQVRPQLPVNEEFLSLEARLDKDWFLATRHPEEKAERGKKARDLYAKAFEQSGTYYPAINAATLSLLIGDAAEAEVWACRVLALCDQAPDPGGLDGYYLRATRAEACLLLGRDDEAARWLTRAREARPWDLGNLSTTYRQLKRICEHRGLTLDRLAPIRPPTVIAYTGQMIHGLGRTPGIDPDDAPALKSEIAALLEQHRVRVAYGSLACGADLLVAEAVLEAGGELNVILPFAEEEFKRSSVAPAGADWVRRFDQAFRGAASVSLIVEDGATGYDLLFEACSRQAMGLAHLRSETLGARAYQIAVWNGHNADSPAGTAGAMQRWAALGKENLVVPVPAPRRAGAAKPDSAAREGTVTLRRQMKAMIFADVKGYSGLKEKQLPAFVSRWMESLNGILEANRGPIQYINTWGDAVYLVMEGTAAAARTALQMARLFSDWDFPALGLPATLGLRVAAHVGPIFETRNPVIGKPDFFGMHVNQTARLEPCTPVGSVYVTEPFAALISLEAAGQYRCEYVGNHPLPKNFGRIRMYHLTETA